MAKKTEPTIFTNGLHAQLQLLEYKFINFPENFVSIKPKDTFKLIECSKEKFVVDITRTVEFEENQLYKLKVIVREEFTIDQEKTFSNFQNFDEFKKELNKKLVSFVNQSPAYNEISLVIGQITSMFGNVPVVLPPNYLKK
ncbi:hypothetical protein [Solobacterium moorei]|uniref:hypothetical protein n=1 Tax=Solobacterium moorei TaxID=102148 RepID=UPI000590FC05|nr:hypothetical protein [Solobacterium moorei]